MAQVPTIEDREDPVEALRRRADTLPAAAEILLAEAATAAQRRPEASAPGLSA